MKLATEITNYLNEKIFKSLDDIKTKSNQRRLKGKFSSLDDVTGSGLVKGEDGKQYPIELFKGTAVIGFDTSQDPKKTLKKLKVKRGDPVDMIINKTLGDINWIKF